MPEGLESDKSQSLREEVIKHLSSEITSEMEYLASLRTRLAFTVLTGPFIIVGSVLIAFRGPLVFRGSHGRVIFVAGAVALLSYMLLAVYCAFLDNHSTGQCNKWRRAIVSLLNGKNVDESELVFKHYAFRAYLSVFAIVVVAFVSLIFLVLQLVPLQSPHGG